MSLPTWFHRRFLRENDALARYRDELGEALSAPVAVLFALLALNNAWQQRWTMAAVTLGVAGALVLNHIGMQRKRGPVVGYVWLLAFGLAGAVLAVHHQGVLGSFWAFPLMLTAYFAIPRFQALLFGALITVCMPAAVAMWIDPYLAIRLAVSLALTLSMLQVIMNVQVHLQERLTNLSRTDALTGVFNRRHLEESLVSLVAAAGRSPPSCALLLLDLDHFKRINDQHGHAVGDEALRSLTQVLKTRLRRTDRVFRLGGEEFVVLLDPTTLNGAARTAEALRQATAGQASLPGIPLTVSIGVSWLTPTDTPESWMRRADEALYRAKHEGRNRVVVAADPTNG